MSPTVNRFSFSGGNTRNLRQFGFHRTVKNIRYYGYHRTVGNILLLGIYRHHPRADREAGQDPGSRTRSAEDNTGTVYCKHACTV